MSESVQSLKVSIQDAMKVAMRAKDKARLGVIRLMLAAIKQREVDERIELSDQQVIAILEKMIKQRKDSISQYTAGGRPELAEVEAQEIVVIQDFMPALLSADEVQKLLEEAISSASASSIRDMGKVMGILRSQVQGRADMSQVSAMVKERLS
jgi:uncharacterized protein